MADRIFCIDFGSAFTKVALRRDPGATADLIGRSAKRTVADADFCFPSAVAIDRNGPKPRCEFGNAVARMTTGDGIEVHQNWTKWLFQAVPPAGAAAAPSALDALLRSDEFRGLAEKFGVPPARVGYFRQLVAAAEGLTGRQLEPAVAVEAKQQAFAASLALHYFGWLRRQVKEAFETLPVAGLNFDAIPVRVAVPAFGHSIPRGTFTHPGTTAVLDALRKAGWPLHPDEPVVTEPYSNAIGVLTHGLNAVHNGKIQFAPMFEKGPFVTVLNKASTYPTYRALVIDVGAYTTDLAAVTLDTGGKAVDDPRDVFHLDQVSVPLGISSLDDQVAAAIPAEKAAKLKQNTPEQWETFRRNVYTDREIFRRPGLVVGGKDEKELLSATLTAFGRSVADEVVKFCATRPPAARQELILTGGGSAIPSVRDELLAAASANGHTYVKVHAPDVKRKPGGPPVDKLDEKFVRGGSAAGGASVYFEKSFY